MQFAVGSVTPIHLFVSPIFVQSGLSGWITVSCVVLILKKLRLWFVLTTIPGTEAFISFYLFSYLVELTFISAVPLEISSGIEFYPKGLRWDEVRWRNKIDFFLKKIHKWQKCLQSHCFLLCQNSSWLIGCITFLTQSVID